MVLKPAKRPLELVSGLRLRRSIAIVADVFISHWRRKLEREGAPRRFDPHGSRDRARAAEPIRDQPAHARPDSPASPRTPVAIAAAQWPRAVVVGALVVLEFDRARESTMWPNWIRRLDAIVNLQRQHPLTRVTPAL